MVMAIFVSGPFPPVRVCACVCVRVCGCQAHAAKVAQQHYHLQLKRRVWLGWHGLLRGHWKEQVERACRARAEEVCERLSADYEARIAQVRRKRRRRRGGGG